MTGTFTFLVDPRTELAVPAVVSSVEIGGRAVGHLVPVPVGFRHIAAHPERAREGVSRAVDHAVRLGSSVVGLGALAAEATTDGATLRHRTDIGVTNGHAFTAAVVYDQVRSLLAVTPGARVVVLGATGSVGATVTKLLVRGHDVDELLLVSRDERRLASLACNLGHRGVAVRTSSHARDANAGDILVDGARVSNPSFAEAALLALSGHEGHFSIGIPDLAQVDHVRDLARQHPSLGFTVTRRAA